MARDLRRLSIMRLFTIAAACLALFCIACGAEPNLTTPLSSHQILPDNFKPPQVFKNINLLRNINLEKGYVKETVNVIIENTDTNAQDTYFIPFKAEAIANLGGLEVRDKKDPEKPAFVSEVVEYDPYSPTQFHRVTLPTPLAPSAQQTLSINYHILSALTPLPATINQQDKQYLVHTFSTYSPSAYVTEKQKTKIKFQTTNIPDHTGDPERQGTTFTYGPYGSTPAGAEQEASVRYEFTKPVIHVTLLERDIEISQWGGNLATEERYWLTNKGAHLTNQFSRVEWARTQHYSPPTSALRELNIPLQVGSLDPYFTDDIGNVSTSRFRSNLREANLVLKPRYPVFGGWKYSFRVGWSANLKSFLRTLQTGDGQVLKVPFLEGPKMGEGISYEKVDLRVILPEGATNVKYQSPVPLVASEVSLHKTFMDTLGRTTLKLTAMNVVDEARDKDLIVTYDYPFIAAYRKPITIFAGVMAVFVTAWGIGRLDVSIAKPS
ncbi:dolichyl-diphosphooligosaccharide--protein glycosyltransferase subunit 1 [Mycoblastus sanguinarius]|nr:dolichyl-diphosphooligosaccharide--protein glycosyltransferase subunit 1 [Mycoblastus sanguinarius]